MKRVFFLSLLILFSNFDDWLSSNFHRLLFCAYVEIHQVRRQVFDNYQRCPVSLIKVMVCCMGYPTLFLISFNEFKTLPARLLLVHISPILYKLHLLPVKQRIIFKLLVTTLKCKHGIAPQYMYLKELIHDYCRLEIFVLACKISSLLFQPPPKHNMAKGFSGCISLIM